jgi:predicted nucleotidyltransferase
LSYRKASKIPYANIRKASQYLEQKGVKTAFIFGSGLKVANPRHDLDIAVDLPPMKMKSCSRLAVTIFSTRMKETWRTSRR